MTPEKRKKTEAAGHTVTTVEDFLGLRPAEAALVEARLAVEPRPAPEPASARSRPARESGGGG